MKRDDPKRLKLRGDRQRAQAWLDILCKGIGKKLVDDGYSSEPEDVRETIKLVNGELLEALIASEKAEAAYRPYWSRRRVRTYRVPKRKTKSPRAGKSKSSAKQKPKTKQ
jgi:hypothetical protein